MASVNLVTGGAGFIGTNLTNYLLAQGEKVICLDNFLSGSKININRFLTNKNFKIFEKNILEEINIKVDKIWHFACPASPNFYMNNPIQTSNICYVGTLNMLKLARKNNARFLLASTSEIYGKSTKMPISEDNSGSVDTISKRACYSESKRLAETLCLDFSREYSLEVRIARIFNTYGPYLSLNDGRVIGMFLSQALNNKSLTVHGDGTQTRSFCYVDDLIDGLVKLMNSNYSLPINLGNDEEISIFELAQIILNKVNPNLKVNFTNSIQDEPLRRKPCLKKSLNILGWQPKVLFSEGINYTIEYIKSLNK